MNQELPEHELVKRSRLGDERAFLELYVRHRDHVFGFAYRMLGERGAAEDTTQDCFLSLMRQLDRFDLSRASLGTYLYAIARNLCYRRFRDANPEPIQGPIEEEPKDERSPLNELLDAELSTQVAQAVAGLPEFQREAIILFEFEGRTLAEIAIIAETDIGTVKSRLFRARQRLRNELAPYLKNDSIRVAKEE
ncbi:MAG TPA: sigma-70 family RNA polymerase sigma factor [Terriglobia bacterium]|nr:sigma-70 family RNA polymerase sigma factor [Terriglobia bacterium]